MVNRPFYSLFSLLLIFTAYVTASGAVPKLAIPTYAPPGSAAWKGWQAVGPNGLGFMIINLKNGDDTKFRPEVAAAVQSAQRDGIPVLAYTYTSYGKRDVKAVLERIDAHYNNYKTLDGIFVDEAATDCNDSNRFAGTQLKYYRQITDRIRSKSGRHLVVYNPGTMPPTDCWMPLVDILLTHENKGLKSYQEHYDDAAWVRQFPPERFWHLVYSVATEAEMREVVNLACKRGVGYLYVTHAGLPNPWSEVPPYLAAEAEAWTGHAVPKATPQAGKLAAIRFRSPKGTNQQIFIDVDQRLSTGFRSPSIGVGAEFLIEVSGTGSASMLRYTGSGTDWTWTPLPVTVRVVAPEPGIDVLLFDPEPLGNAKTVKLQSLTVDGGWNPLHITDPVRWEVTK